MRAKADRFVVDEKIEKAQASPTSSEKPVSEFFYEPLSELESFVVQDGYLEATSQDHDDHTRLLKARF